MIKFALGARAICGCCQHTFYLGQEQQNALFNQQGIECPLCKNNLDLHGVSERQRAILFHKDNSKHYKLKRVIQTLLVSTLAILSILTHNPYAISILFIWCAFLCIPIMQQAYLQKKLLLKLQRVKDGLHAAL